MEFGSWDPSLSAMVNISYAGTHLTNGQPDNATACTTQFDETGFMMGTSASLFNVSTCGCFVAFPDGDKMTLHPYTSKFSTLPVIR
jgi:Lysophospholipase catalytic domain